MRPVTDDTDTGGFFRHAAAEELAVSVCRSCDTVLHPPTGMCFSCGSTAITWRPVAPTGHLVTWTVVERQVHEDFPTPYTVVLVELDDEPGVRFVGSLPGCPDLHAGQRMEASFTENATVSWRPMASQPNDPVPPATRCQGDGT